MSSRKRSILWNYFIVTEESEDKPMCKYCNSQISIKGGATTNLRKHLDRKHPGVYGQDSDNNSYVMMDKQEIENGEEAEFEVLHEEVKKAIEMVNTENSPRIQMEKKLKRKQPTKIFTSTPSSSNLHTTNSQITEEDEELKFFRSLIPDVKQLSTRRRRHFRMHVLNGLNSLLDEQEDEILSGNSQTKIDNI